MISVGITGSYASGKSFLLNHLAEMGYKIFSADIYVSDLYKELAIQQQVLQLFPNLKIFDKKKLAEEIYSSDLSRRKIHEFVHPFVARALDDFKSKNNNEIYIFAEIPLLFESGFTKYFDFIVTTICLEESRLKRAMAKPGFNQLIYDRIKQIQITQEEKAKMADFVLNTDSNLLELEHQLEKLKKLLDWKYAK